jgi:hypothetical protein
MKKALILGAVLMAAAPLAAGRPGLVREREGGHFAENYQQRRAGIRLQAGYRA